MMIASENQLLSIDETCLSNLSDENESTISGGTFLLSGFLSNLFGGLPSNGSSQPSTASTGITITVSNSVNNTNTNSSSSNSGSSSNSSSSTGGGHGGGYGGGYGGW